MARPRMNDELSPLNIIERMIPGKTYGAAHIAVKMHVGTVTVRPLLEQMVKDGLLEVSRERPAMIGFRRPSADENRTEPPETVLSVAGPPMTVRFDVNLTGYDAEFSRRVALCMMVRPR